MSEVENIASKHLGKASDGTTVQPYVTPNRIDSSLLVPVPRVYNRTDYGIEENDLEFVGCDVWNCYEVSFLTNNGYPVSGVLKIIYDCESECIVESKSLKLYLNSFNMSIFGKTVALAIDNASFRIQKDLEALLEVSVAVKFHYNEENDLPAAPVKGHFVRLETLVDVDDVVFEDYNEDPDILEHAPMLGFMPFQVTTSALRSNCRVTNQPDWGDVYIHISGEDCVTPESLMRYIISMRKENHFHEEICECIYQRLRDLLHEDTDILVTCLYTRRGGIDINPVRASNSELLDSIVSYLIDEDTPHRKTARQ
tara:strand:- start:5293 stop:6225 length:933 start_codon:yes stop_codon:yes gene_type:complete